MHTYIFMISHCITQ